MPSNTRVTARRHRRRTVDSHAPAKLAPVCSLCQPALQLARLRQTSRYLGVPRLDRRGLLVGLKRGVEPFAEHQSVG